MIGGGVRWGDHRIVGAGASATDNTTAPNGARANIGVVVLAMYNAVLANNSGPVKLVDGNPLARWGRCPQLTLAVGAAELASTSITPAAAAGARRTSRRMPARRTLTARPRPPAGRPERRLPRRRLDRRALHTVGHADPGVIAESFWNTDFDRLVEAFRESRRMGSNIVRFNLQFSAFVGPPSPGHPDGTPNETNLARLQDTVDLAEQMGMYIELSGLRIQLDYDNGDWYATRDEAARWRSQAVFWSAIARQLEHSDAVAWFDLMNEPRLRPRCSRRGAAPRSVRDCYVQFLTKDPAGRTTVEVIREWMTVMRTAIRETAGDTDRLISVGGLPYGRSGFRPARRHRSRGDRDRPPVSGGRRARSRRARRRGGETGRPAADPRRDRPCGGGDVSAFILGTSESAAGWVGHYFERTPAEILSSPSPLGDYWHLGFYRTFMRLSAAVNAHDDGVMQP